MRKKRARKVAKTSTTYSVKGGKATKKVTKKRIKK